MPYQEPPGDETVNTGAYLLVVGRPLGSVDIRKIPVTAVAVLYAAGEAALPQCPGVRGATTVHIFV